MTPALVAEAATFLALLAQPGDVLELRGLVKAQGAPHVTSGYFDDLGQLAAAAVERNGKDDGVYVTINPVHPGLLARAPKNRARRAGNGETTSDRDVQRRRSLLIDVDPVRPQGISSTNEEHDAAIALAAQIATELAATGWPMPIRLDSGNGAHLIYAVDLPVDDAGLIKRVLAALSKRYSTAQQKIDEKVFNPARISKIPGTLTRKGESTPDRPHRYARILSAPDAMRSVSIELLEQIAGPTPSLNAPRPRTFAFERKEFDLDTWIAEHLPDARERSWSEGRMWILRPCPINSAHDRGEAFICRKHDGMIAAGCQHESCFHTWRELRVHFEPDAYKRAATNGHRVSHREPPEVVYESPDLDPAAVAEIDAFADRDRESVAIAELPWKTAPELVDPLWAHKDDPWISLKLGVDELHRVRAGNMAVLIGGPASGKSSLASCLLIEHARHAGPAIAMSIELPAEELAARIVGVRCDAGWEDALRGGVPYEHLQTALALPRLYVIEREQATLANVERCLDAAKAAYPNEPLLLAIDYAQLVASSEKEARLRVADTLQRIDRLLRSKLAAGLVLSQMGRAGAKSARSGEAIGVDASELGAESSAIERFAAVTLTIGQRSDPSEDGSQSVELSIGKVRMGTGDGVIPMRFWGKSGLWRVAGDVERATQVRENRDSERTAKRERATAAQIVGLLARSTRPMTRNELIEQLSGKRTDKLRLIREAITSGDIVEVDRRSPHSKQWCVWVRDRAIEAKIDLISEAT